MIDRGEHYKATKILESNQKTADSSCRQQTADSKQQLETEDSR
jgi:hypothetical protein